MLHRCIVCKRRFRPSLHLATMQMHRHCCTVCKLSGGFRHSHRCTAICSNSPGDENLNEANSELATLGFETSGARVMVLVRGDVRAARVVAENEYSMQVCFASDNTLSVVDMHNVHTCRSIGDITFLVSLDHVVVFWNGEFHDAMVNRVIADRTVEVLWAEGGCMSFVDIKYVYVSTWDECSDLSNYIHPCSEVALDVPGQQSCSATPLASSLGEARLPLFSPCECRITWRWCADRCRVAAGWLRSNLCFGTLDHALCKEFLDWFNISHVVSVLGEFSLGQKEADRGRFRGIQYQRWSINHIPSFEKCMVHFASWQRVLESGGRILLHCKSGKDRSAFAAYMYLRHQLGYTDQEALKCLSCRVDRYGIAFANIRGNDLFSIYTDYVAAGFFRRVQADALLPSWQYGFG